MKARLAAIGAVLLLAFGGAVAVAAPAQASDGDCLTGRLCVWHNYNYPGSPVYYWTISGGSGGYCVNFGGSLNDNVDSWTIKSEAFGRSATMYSNANCSGTPISYIAPTWNGGPSKMNCLSGSWSTHSCINGAHQGSSAWIIR